MRILGLYFIEPILFKSQLQFFWGNVVAYFTHLQIDISDNNCFILSKFLFFIVIFAIFYTPPVLLNLLFQFIS